MFVKISERSWKQSSGTAYLAWLFIEGALFLDECLNPVELWRREHVLISRRQDQGNIFLHGGNAICCWWNGAEHSGSSARVERRNLLKKCSGRVRIVPSLI